MSYDLYAIAARPDEDPAEVYAALGEAGEGEAAEWTDEQVARAEKLAALLQALNPRLERFVFDYPEVAKALGVTEDDARAQWRHIELNTPDEQCLKPVDRPGRRNEGGCTFPVTKS